MVGVSIQIDTNQTKLEREDSNKQMLIKTFL